MRNFNPMKPRALVSLLVLSVGLFSSGCGAHAAYTAVPAASGLAALAKAKAPASYYKGVGDLSGQKLLAALQRITSKGHRDLGYDRARDVMFGHVDDLDGDGRSRTVYTGYLLVNVHTHQEAYHQGGNAEHTWPQSMGAVGIAKADLHHLYPALMEANSTRNNHAFGDVQKVRYTLADYIGDGQHSRIGFPAHASMRDSDLVFEPRDDHKGNVARSLFYFYMRYGNHTGGKEKIRLTNFVREEQTLKRWMETDPVDDAERARNEAVYKAQGNRNPFVDHPEWVKRVGKFVPR